MAWETHHACEEHEADAAGEEAIERKPHHIRDQAVEPAIDRTGKGDDADGEDRARERRNRRTRCRPVP